MNRDEMYIALEKAQELLSQVYFFSSASKLNELERLMSVADTMICEAYEEIECGETQKYLENNDA